MGAVSASRHSTPRSGASLRASPMEVAVRNRNLLFLLLAATLLVRPGLAPAAPLGTGFTYQGQLTQGGTPVEGVVTLRFSLWDAVGSGAPPTGGTMVGAVQTLTNVAVTGGVFSVALNGNGEFGALAFNGDARWLQVEVCGDTNCTSTTVLGPRQAITGTPYALGPWQPGNASISYPGGNVGIGTAAPASRLDVRGGAMAVEHLGDQADLLWLNSERSWVFRQDGTGAGTALKLESVGGGGNKNFIVQTTGFVGVGTSLPAAKLDVRGDIRLGASGELLATGSGEALRIVRGEVLAAGSISAGTGFTVTHPATGIYNIIFTQPFLATSHPAFSVTAVANSGTLIAMASSLPGPSLCALRIVNGSGTAADGAFSFTVIGAR